MRLVFASLTQCALYDPMATDTVVCTVEIWVQGRVIDGESLSECECDSFVLFLISSSSSQSWLISNMSFMSVPPIWNQNTKTLSNINFRLSVSNWKKNTYTYLCKDVKTLIFCRRRDGGSALEWWWALSMSECVVAVDAEPALLSILAANDSNEIVIIGLSIIGLSILAANDSN